MYTILSYALCTLAPLRLINCNWSVRQWVASSDGLIIAFLATLHAAVAIVMLFLLCFAVLWKIKLSLIDMCVCQNVLVA